MNFIKQLFYKKCDVCFLKKEGVRSRQDPVSYELGFDFVQVFCCDDCYEQLNKEADAMIVETDIKCV